MLSRPSQKYNAELQMCKIKNKKPWKSHGLANKSKQGPKLLAREWAGTRELSNYTTITCQHGSTLYILQLWFIFHVFLHIVVFLVPDMWSYIIAHVVFCQLSTSCESGVLIVGEYILMYKDCHNIRSVKSLQTLRTSNLNGSGGISVLS